MVSNEGKAQAGQEEADGSGLGPSQLSFELGSQVSHGNLTPRTLNRPYGLDYQWNC